MKMIRYADDFVILVHGTRDDARALRAEVGRVLAPMGLRLSADKTRLTHIEEGFEFLGWRIQRRKKKGTRGTTRALHLPVEEVTGFDHRQDPDPDPQDGSSDTRRPPAQTQPGDPRLVRLFPARGLQAHVLLRRQLRLPANTRLALQAPPPPEQAHRQPPVPARVAHPGRRNRVLPSLQGPRDPLPLPGNPHPQSPRRRTPRHNTGGEPDAQECARPVRRAAGGNPPAKTRAGRHRVWPCDAAPTRRMSRSSTPTGAVSTPHSNSPGTWGTTGSAPP